MPFDVNGKVALITGGASGIGFGCAQELLNNGLRGATIVDIDEETGQAAVATINSKFGENKAIFVKADITNYFSFEGAFRATIDEFNNIDILINNAGVCDDSVWEKEIAVNVNGAIHGMLLGLDNYLPKYRSFEEAVIVNVSSIRGVDASGDRPIYSATKFAVHGMTLGWGRRQHYDRTKVKVLGVCPGSTNTPLIANPQDTNLGPDYEAIRLNRDSPDLPNQTADQCAQCIVEVIKTAETGTIWIVENGEKYRYVMPDRSTMK